MDLIPAWLVSLMALLATCALLSVERCPLAIRISVGAPMLYFAALYLYAATSDVQAIQRTELVRMGLLLIFFAVSVNAVAARFLWRRRRP